MKGFGILYILFYGSFFFVSCINKTSDHVNKRVHFIDSLLNNTVTVNKEIYIDSIPNKTWDRMQRDYIYDSLNRLFLVVDRIKKDSFEYFSTGLFVNDTIAWVDLRYTVNKAKTFYTTYYLQDTAMIKMERKGEQINDYKSSIKYLKEAQLGFYKKHKKIR